VSDPPKRAEEGSSGGWWQRFADRLATGRKAYVADWQELFGRPALDEQFFDDLEGTLLSADVGAATTERTLRRLREEAASAHLRTPTDALRYLKQGFLQEMQRMDRRLRLDGQPAVVLVVGVNGSGKTTTVAKLAHLLGQSGHRPLIAAADTYRAAAIDQLRLWGERAATPVIAHQPGSDPGAVAYDAIRAARARGSDVVLVDTAGRLHTRTDLMDELRKIRRVIQRQDPAAPQEVLAVLDAHIGQNSAQQVRRFGEAVQLTGLAVTKMDGSARAGVVLSIEEELQVPTKLVGIGEGLDDLNFFDPARYLDALLGL
jgi:fused signal recognition particle receptor